MGAPGWIDLVDPSPDTLVAKVPSRLEPSAIDALCANRDDSVDARPTLESHGTYVLGALLFPGPLDDEQVVYRELGLVASPGMLVTVRKTASDGQVADLAGIERADADASTTVLVHRLFDAAADSYHDLVDALYVEIDALEDRLDELPPSAIRERLSTLRHEMLHARRNASATRATVRRIMDGRLEVDVGGATLFPPETERAFADTYDQLVRAIEELDIARDLIASVRDYLQSRVAESQNAIVQRLTMVASLVLVPTFITGFYGQNFTGVFQRGYWTLGVSVSLIVATTLAQLAFFRWKRWL